MAGLGEMMAGMPGGPGSGGAGGAGGAGDAPPAMSSEQAGLPHTPTPAPGPGPSPSLSPSPTPGHKQAGRSLLTHLPTHELGNLQTYQRTNVLGRRISSSR